MNFKFKNHEKIIVVGIGIASDASSHGTGT
jgi:hypothetical protein